MATAVETNILLPQCALDALAEYCRNGGVKRDPTVRALIDQYIDMQSQLKPDDRLTHISTVIWHPDMPIGRNTRSSNSARLRMRLPMGAAEQAGQFALRLPGQTEAIGGYHDYRPRLLADAFLTALAHAVPFTDEVLDGLPPLLTHQQAIGLFRLGVAASATWAEQRIYVRADSDLDRLYSTHKGTVATDPGAEHAIAIATLLREEDIAWHGHWRRAVTRHLARDLLTGEDVGDTLAMLSAQDPIRFGTLRRDLEQDGDFRSGQLQGLRPVYNDYEGRGGTAIWRAERRVETEQMLSWLARTSASKPADSPRRTFTMREPGWDLAVPDQWQPVTIRHGDDERLNPHLAQARAGRVVHARSGGTHIFWPYQPVSGHEEKLEPVPGLATALAAADGRPAARIIEYLLAPAHCEQVPVSAGPVQMNAFVAHDLGFIDQDERDTLVDRAREETLRRMRIFCDAVPERRAGLRQQLQDAMDCPAEFTQLVARLEYQRAVHGSGEHSVAVIGRSAVIGRVHFYETRTAVPWPREQTSLADEIDSGLAAGRLAWLSQHVFRRFDHVLEMSMDRAWKHALQGYRSVTSATIDDL